MEFLSLLLSWQVQSILFAILAIAVTLVYWKKIRRFNNKTERSLLNSRIASLIGRSVSLLTPTQNGTAKVQIENAFWTVSCSEDLHQGAIVDIVGADGMTLLVKQHIKVVVDIDKPE